MSGHRYARLYREWAEDGLTMLGLGRKYSLSCVEVERRIRLAWRHARRRTQRRHKRRVHEGFVMDTIKESRERWPQ